MDIAGTTIQAATLVPAEAQQGAGEEAPGTDQAVFAGIMSALAGGETGDPRHGADMAPVPPLTQPPADMAVALLAAQTLPVDGQLLPGLAGSALPVDAAAAALPATLQPLARSVAQGVAQALANREAPAALLRVAPDRAAAVDVPALAGAQAPGSTPAASTPLPGLADLLPEVSPDPTAPVSGKLQGLASAAIEGSTGGTAADTRTVLPALGPLSTTAAAARGVEGAAAGAGGDAVDQAGLQRMEVPFGSSRWDSAIGQRVAMMVRQAEQSAELVLDPPHLGRLEVRVAMQQDQASVSFVSAHAQVREALEAAMPRLREMLGHSGIDLVNVDVSHGQGNDQGELAGQMRDGRGDDDSPTAALLSEEAGEAEVAEPALPRGLVDAYA